MNDPTQPPSIYQFRAVLNGVSPMVCQRLGCNPPGKSLREPRRLRQSNSWRTSLSLQCLTKRLCRLPGLLVADVGIAHGRADILVAKQLLDFP
jgi:hypothetical protein